MGQQREPRNKGQARTLPGPLRATEEDECRRGGADDRERKRMRDRAVRDGPSEIIDIGQGGAGRGDEADLSRRWSLLGPGSDCKTNRRMRDGGRHRVVSG